MGEKGTYHFQIPVISCHFSWLQSWKSKCNQEKLCIGCLQDTLFCCCYVYFIFIEKKKKLCSMVMTCCGEHIGVKSHLNIEEIILYLKKDWVQGLRGHCRWEMPSKPDLSSLVWLSTEETGKGLFLGGRNPLPSGCCGSTPSGLGAPGSPAG